MGFRSYVCVLFSGSPDGDATRHTDGAAVGVSFDAPADDGTCGAVRDHGGPVCADGSAVGGGWDHPTATCSQGRFGSEHGSSDAGFIGKAGACVAPAASHGRPGMEGDADSERASGFETIPRPDAGDSRSSTGPVYRPGTEVAGPIFISYHRFLIPAEFLPNPNPAEGDRSSPVGKENPMLKGEER